jgi:hypothetical protein
MPSVIAIDATKTIVTLNHTRFTIHTCGCTGGSWKMFSRYALSAISGTAK